MKIDPVDKKIELFTDSKNSPCKQHNFKMLAVSNNCHLLIGRVQGIFAGPLPLR
jgi:hypothetical protein